VYTEPDGKQEASVQAKRLDFGLMLFPTTFRTSTSNLYFYLGILTRDEHYRNERDYESG